MERGRITVKSVNDFLVCNGHFSVHSLSPSTKGYCDQNDQQYQKHRQ